MAGALHLIVIDEEKDPILSFLAPDLKEYLEKLLPREVVTSYRFLGRVRRQGDTGCEIEIINKEGGALVFFANVPADRWVGQSLKTMPSSMVIIDKRISFNFRRNAIRAGIRCYVFKKAKEEVVPEEKIPEIIEEEQP